LNFIFASFCFIVSAVGFGEDMDTIVKPARRMIGTIQVPGDKSISHRLAILGAIAEGQTFIDNFASSQDCQSTLSCLRLLGVPIETSEAGRVTLSGQGLRGLTPPRETLDARNSGSTIRMLSGVLAGQSFRTEITGDASLRRRPMGRIIAPLTQMGATIQAREGNYPPLSIQGGPLRSIHYLMPVASAQVKSAVLLAGLLAEGETYVTEPVSSRNHTEVALKEFGAEVHFRENRISLKGGQRLRGVKARVPGDISSAAFFLVASALLPESEIVLTDVGMNPGRSLIIHLLQGMGASIEVLNQQTRAGEPVADLRVKPGSLTGGTLSGESIPQVIDEIPILAVLGTQSEKGLEIRDAAELRVKESDRIKSIVQNLRSMGASVEEFADGMFVPGRQSLQGARIHTHDDHRIAMAFAVAALIAKGASVIEGSECTAVSFPGFFELLDRVAVR
jgi:3-phosphoshikimate 1-carboxyvinyltransferase